MKLSNIPFEFAVMVCAQSFLICLIGYYLKDGRPVTVGAGALALGVMTIIGIVLIPGKRS